MPTIHTIQVIEVDGNPVTSFYNGPEAFDPEYEDLPEPFAAALRDLIDNPDDRLCASCGHGVGYVLAGEADEFLNWHWTSLVRVPPTHYPENKGKDGTPVMLLCEDCTPIIPNSEGKPR
jgi:hypothetical protein